MLLKIRVKDEFLKELLENLPEASESFAVHKWDYKTPSFDLQDMETGETYRLNMTKARKGFKVLAEKLLAGELPGLGLTTKFLTDSCDWDGPAIDAFVQCCVLGDVIYG